MDLLVCSSLTVVVNFTFTRTVLRNKLMVNGNQSIYFPSLLNQIPNTGAAYFKKPNKITPKTIGH